MNGSLRAWENAAIVAALVIVMTIPVYLWKESAFKETRAQNIEGEATYVGRDKCIDCHKKAYESWKGSDHDLAMAPASQETVLGDFNGATFESDGVVTTFSRMGEKFIVRTQGESGEVEDFEVKYVFGHSPLQQYLIPFPGGRLQCLTIAWDTEKKEWFDLYPDLVTPPGDWLHWTRQAQNWNSMCADCHSTDVSKSFDPETKTYDTTWSEIDVSCEACHGPGSLHVSWAKIDPMGRPDTNGLYLLQVDTRDLSNEGELSICAPCHSRRYLLGDYDPDGAELLDHLVPRLLEENVYYPDGQIQDEVYVYGSFIQSKMYRMGVKCSDCHDSHSLKRRKEGNDLCLQCHRAKDYDTTAHHFHKLEVEGKPSEGALCVKCHMPESPFMVVDWRADHSIRNPRPDLTIETESPNACNAQGCHSDKPVQWSVDAMEKWYGQRKRPHYAGTFKAARQGLPEALGELTRIAGDRLYSSIVRATAISHLQGYPGEQSTKSLELALGDDEALVRLTAIRTLNNMRHPGNLRLVKPLLYDPVSAVRIEAAANIFAAAPDGLPEGFKPLELKKFKAELQRYKGAMTYASDFAYGRFNLANLAWNKGDEEESIMQYGEAIEIDNLFYPAKTNLALLLNQRGENEKAEALLREVLDDYPEQHMVAYNLGLLLSEVGDYRESAKFLQIATEGMPGHARARFNLAQLQQYFGEFERAEQSLLEALELEPANGDFLFSLLDQYIRKNEISKGRAIAKRIITLFPQHPSSEQINQFLKATDPNVGN